jgi:hypothetical protein
MTLSVIVCLMLSSAVWVHAQPQYAVTDLGEFVPEDVNDHHQVIGRVGGRPAIWKDGAIMVMQDLGAGGHPRRWSESIPGISVGSITYPSTGYEGAAQWDASGALTILAQNASHGSVAFGQNGAGVTAGVHGRPDAIYGAPVQSAARWDDPSSLTVLDTRDGQWSYSAGIDREGNVWGGDEQNQTVIWDTHGNKLVIPGNPGRWTSFVSVSEPGVGTGLSTNSPRPGVFVSTPVQATLEQGFSVLPQLDGGSCAPVDVNRAGTILGNCWMADTATYLPVRWQKGTISVLPLEVPEGIRNFTVVGLSDAGLLVGRGSVTVQGPYGPESRTRGYLLTPIARVAQCGGSVPCQCGDTVVADYTFTHNLACTLHGFEAALLIGHGVMVNGAGFGLFGTGDGIGILFDEVQGSQVIGLHVTNFATGVRLRAAASGNVYRDAWVWNHAQQGIHLEQSAHSNWIWGVYSLLNGASGMTLEDVSENILAYNMAWSNPISLHMVRADQNTVWFNGWYGDRGHAVVLDESHGNSFYRNDVVCSGGGAVILHNSLDNTAHENTVQCPVSTDQAMATR